MTNIEKKITAWVEKNIAVFFIAAVSVLALFARLSAFKFLSPDAEFFLLPWFDEIKLNGGLAALGQQVGDYNIPFQFIIGLLTYLDFEPLYMYKSLSCSFDFALAIVVAFLAQTITKNKSRLLFCTVYTTVLFIPTTIMNSAIWAQCDSIYVTFVLASLLFLFKKRNVLSFVFLGIALTLKLQTVFILPFFIYFYFAAQGFSLLHFIIPVLTAYIACIPAFFCGRSLLAPFEIYFSQTGTYEYMYLKFPSIWALVGDNYAYMSKFAVMTTVAVLGLGLLYVITKKPNLCSADGFISAACWSVWTCLLFLPAMHERYGYLLDILLIVAAAVNRKKFIFAIVAVLSSAACYGIYLFQTNINLQLLALIYLATYIAFTYMTVNSNKAKS